MGALPAIGFQVWCQFTDWPSLAATVRRIEALGFASVWANDHLFAAAGSQEALIDWPAPFDDETLVALADVVERAGQGPLGG